MSQSNQTVTVDLLKHDQIITIVYTHQKFLEHSLCELLKLIIFIIFKNNLNFLLSLNSLKQYSGIQSYEGQ